jgi:predicted nucleic acid-binding protein
MARRFLRLPSPPETALRRTGRAAPATDLLIAAAAVAGECELWHRDRHFETIATVTPLKQRPF